MLIPHVCLSLSAVYGAEDLCTNRGCVFTKATDSEESKCEPPSEKPYILPDFASGRHCVEAWIKTASSDKSRAVTLLYMGPDTKNTLATIPEPVLHPRGSIEGEDPCRADGG